MKVNHTLSILFWINLQKKDHQGKAPVYCRITLDGKRTQFSTGKKVIPKQWDSRAGRVKGTSEEFKTINEELDLLKGDIRKTYNQLSATNTQISGEMLKAKLLGTEEDNKTVMQLYYFVKELYHNKYSQGKAALKTWQRFTTVTCKMERFLKLEYGKDKLLAHLDHAFAENFHHYLQLKESLTDNTINKYIRISRQAFDYGIRKGWLTSNPLAIVKTSYKPPNRYKLSLQEIEQLCKLNLHKRHLCIVRDAFIFSCYTGFAYVETYNLTPDNVIIGIDGNKWISTKRQKTDEPELVPLLQPAIDILHRYENDPGCIANNKLLPMLSNQKHNEYLKEIARLANIRINLTTHIARHTFATTILLDHDVPLETVSKLLGHSSIKSTQIYAKVSQKKIAGNMEALKSKLFKNETAKAASG